MSRRGHVRIAMELGLLVACLSLPAQARGIACATAHPLATQACLQVMHDGGNAFDAVVAASAAIAVAEPTGSGLGGGGFWLLHRAQDGFDVFVDGREVAPLAATRDMYLDADGEADPKLSRFGALAAGIPGEPAALEHIARIYGRLPLARSLQPAIAAAREGYAVDTHLAQACARFLPTLSAAARAVFAPTGRCLAVGEPLVQRDLAATLERFARDGARDFYRGETARRLLAGQRDAGGIWSEADLRRYAIVERRPLVTWFRQYRVVTSPPPSAGGIGMAQVLQQLEILGWEGGWKGSSDGGRDVAATHRLIEAFRRAYRDRAAYLGDPDQVTIEQARLTSRSHARALAASIDPARATPSAALAPAQPSPEGGHTTHISVIDADGNRAAATLSINLPFGSGYMAPGTGVLLNDEMDDFAAAPGVANAYGLVGSEPNAIAPGKRPLSSMTPTFVEGPRGVLVIGTPGGSRIVTMVIQGVLDWIGGAPLPDVVAHGRIHHQYLPDAVQLEPGVLSDADADALRAMGHVLDPVPSPWGNMQAVSFETQDDELHAASDPRGVGEARVEMLAAP